METVSARGAEIPVLGLGTWQLTGQQCYESVSTALELWYRHLDTGYVDLRLLHWPNPLVDFADTGRAMAELRDDGLVRHVGVSNFRRWRLRKAREKSPVPLFADQVRCHPFYPRERLRRDCVRENQVLTAYSPLAHGGVVGDDRLARIGDRDEKTAAQVALRWLTQREGVVATPKATSREHLTANVDSVDFELTDGEMDAVERPSLVRTASLFLRNEMVP